jgi:alkanesulfonate monooxygenase SsuD/methylene tetrahydromethanopterin reductase-like flavin-dependent oxidoreductase (luciferase family)
VTHAGYTSIWARDLSGVTARRWIDAIVRLDAAGWPLVILEPRSASDPLDTLSLAAYGFARTQRIGLCATIDPETVEPFTLARGLASLDHLSAGRAAWRLGRHSNVERAAELVDVTRKLLLSWGADALVENVEGGVFSNADAVHAIAHRGAHYAVTGPLNVPRPPQGSVPLVALARDALPAGVADVVLEDDRVLALDLVGDRSGGSATNPADEADPLDQLPPPAVTSMKSLLGVART